MANERVNVVYTANTKDLEQRLRGLEGISDEAAKGIADALGDQFADIEKSAQKMTDDLLGNFGVIGQSLGTLAKSAGPVGLAIAAGLAVAGLAVGGLAKGMFELSESYSTFIDETVIGAAAMGLTEEAFLGLSRTAERAGGSLDEIKEPLKALLRQASLAADGVESSAQKFADLEVKVTDAAGELKPFEEILSDVIRATDELSTPQERAAASMALMGESGAKVTAVLHGQADAILRNVGEVEDLNIITEDALRQSARWDQSVGELGSAWSDFTLILGEAFIPVVNDMLDGMVVLTRVFRDNIDQIRLMIGLTTDLVFNFQDFVTNAFAARTELWELAKAFASFVANPLAFAANMLQASAASWAVTEAAEVAEEAIAAEAEALAEGTSVLDESTEANKRNTEAINARAQAARDAAAAAQSELEAIAGLINFQEITASAESAFDSIFGVIGETMAAAAAAQAELIAGAQAQLGEWAGEAKDLGFEVLDLLADNAAANVEKAEQAITEAGDNISAGEKQRMQADLARQKKHAKAVFKVQKAARLLEAVINGGAAFVRALADYPFPYSLIPAGLVAAVAGVQIATIASSQPSFHDGRRLSMPSTAPDEVNATLLRGERVLGSAAVSALGGNTAIDAIGRGEGGGGRSRAQIFEYEHRSFAAFSADNLRLPGSPLWAAQADPLLGRRS